MDINNYSYINSRTQSEILAHSGTVYLSFDCNWFNECYYTVDDIFSDTDIKIFSRNDYGSAVEYYNSLVPESEKI